ncbi:MAG: phosphoribosylglycinamide formyltransferase [Phycisphaerae bacterium]|nr:phosphoribosylglycinamide formyltransferase [Phycisphaerae bacterium]
MTIDIAVLFSGGGRTVLNLLNQIEAGNLDAKISLAIASKEGLVGIDRLTERGLDVAIARGVDEPLELGDSRTSSWLDDARPCLICLCGYLRLLNIEPWMEGRVINIHPALLPKHGGKGMFGMHVHKSVIESGDQQSGCTVHFVDEQYDHGETIVQHTCEVDADETPQSLADKVFQLECSAYVEAVNKVASQLKV